MTLIQIGLYSWETITLRSLMIAKGTCSLSEYDRMMTEKTTAALNSALALGSGNIGSILRPWHSAVQSNARRLRKG